MMLVTQEIITITHFKATGLIPEGDEVSDFKFAFDLRLTETRYLEIVIDYELYSDAGNNNSWEFEAQSITRIDNNDKKPLPHLLVNIINKMLEKIYQILSDNALRNGVLPPLKPTHEKQKDELFSKVSASIKEIYT